MEAVHRAQACTGALVCLATRTRPELSLGVAAMSRFSTKSPETTLQIGEKIMEYLKRPTLVLIYADHCRPPHGLRQQLSQPRCCLLRRPSHTSLMLQLLGFSIGFVVLHAGKPAGEPIGGDYKARQRRRGHFRFQLLVCQQLKFPMSTDAMPKAPATHVSENGVDFWLRIHLSLAAVVSHVTVALLMSQWLCWSTATA